MGPLGGTTGWDPKVLSEGVFLGRTQFAILANVSQKEPVWDLRGHLPTTPKGPTQGGWEGGGENGERKFPGFGNLGGMGGGGVAGGMSQVLD